MQRFVLPTLGVNDQDALIVWRAGEREAVRRGQVVLTAETTKATFDVEAEADGFLYRLVPDGESTAVGSVLGVIHQQADVDSQTIDRWLALTAVVEAEPTVKRATAKARMLAASRGVD